MQKDGADAAVMLTPTQDFWLGQRMRQALFAQSMLEHELAPLHSTVHFFPAPGQVILPHAPGPAHVT